MFSKKVLTSCLIVTVLARIFDSHGDILHVITNYILIQTFFSQNWQRKGYDTPMHHFHVNVEEFFFHHENGKKMLHVYMNVKTTILKY